MIRYIIERNILDEHGSGVVTLTENGRPRTFVSESDALQWLMENDEDFCNIPIIKLIDYYNIKPYVV